MRKTPKSFYVGVLLMTAVAAFADSPGHNTRIHNEQGNLSPFVRLDPSNPRHPLHWLWKAHQTSATPRFGDNVPAPGEPGDIGGDDVPCTDC